MAILFQRRSSSLLWLLLILTTATPQIDAFGYFPSRNQQKTSNSSISDGQSGNTPKKTTTTKMMMSNQKEPTAQEKVNQEWDGMAGEWDDLASGYAAGLHAVLWDQCQVPDPSGLVVLDFGCGSGLLTERLAPQVSKVVSIDASPKMVDMLRDKIQSRSALKNVQAYDGILANLQTNDSQQDESTSSQFRQAMAALEGTVDIIVASSVLNFVPDDDLNATAQGLGRLLKPGSGLLFHTDWPSGDGQPADGMTEDKAQRIYAAAGLTAESMKVGPLSMGGPGQEQNVFFGLARKL